MPLQLPLAFQGDERKDHTTKMIEEILSLVTETTSMLKGLKETREQQEEEEKKEAQRLPDADPRVVF